MKTSKSLSKILNPSLFGTILFFVLTTGTTIKGLCDAALPNLKSVNSSWISVTNFWTGTEPLQFPTKMHFDFSARTNGVIKGVYCEYPRTDELFESIRQRLQDQLAIKPRFETKGQYTLWRDEVGKRVVSVGFDESKENIRVIVVSVDIRVQ